MSFLRLGGLIAGAQATATAGTGESQLEVV
jgi:hypothetical protein